MLLRALYTFTFSILFLSALAQEGDIVIRKRPQLEKMYIRGRNGNKSSNAFQEFRREERTFFFAKEYEYLLFLNRDEFCIIRSFKSPKKAFKRIEKLSYFEVIRYGSYRFVDGKLILTLDGKSHEIKEPVVYEGAVAGKRITINKMIIDAESMFPVNKVFSAYETR